MAAPAPATARTSRNVRKDGILPASDGNDGEKSRQVEEDERGSAAAGKLISKGLMGHGDLPEDTPKSSLRRSVCHVWLIL
jgi:hypothetical protein